MSERMLCGYGLTELSPPTFKFSPLVIPVFPHPVYALHVLPPSSPAPSTPSTSSLPFKTSTPSSTSTMPKVTTPEPDHIPRPPNRWILYRADKVRELEPPPGQPRRPQSEISKLISQMWAAEPPHVKADYENRAIQAKIQHAIDYPEYQFLPQSKEARQQKRQVKKEQLVKDRLAAKQARGRSTQRPAPTPYTTIPYSHYAATLQYPPPEVRFGPAGPSPPLSAASTPEPELPHQTQQPVASSSHATPLFVVTPTPAPVPQQHASTSLPTPPHIDASSSYPTPVEVAPPTPWSVSDVIWQQAPVQREPSPPSAENDTEDSNDASRHAHTPAPTAQVEEIINFTVPSLADAGELQAWNLNPSQGLNIAGFDFNTNFAELLSPTEGTDSSLFTFPEFDPAHLLQQPLGPIEASLGDLLPAPGEDPVGMLDFPQGGEDLFANFDWSNFATGGQDLLLPPNPTPYQVDAVDPTSVYTSAESTPAPEFTVTDYSELENAPIMGIPALDMLAFAHFNTNPVARSTSVSSVSSVSSKASEASTSYPPPSSQPSSRNHTPTPSEILAQHYANQEKEKEVHTYEPAPPQTTAYVPPAGARRANERRVAGSWRPGQMPRIPS